MVGAADTGRTRRQLARYHWQLGRGGVDPQSVDL